MFLAGNAVVVSASAQMPFVSGITLSSLVRATSVTASNPCNNGPGMNLRKAIGHWQQFKGALVASWGTIAGDRRRKACGRRMQRAGRLDVAYEMIKEALARDIDCAQRRSRTPPATQPSPRRRVHLDRLRDT